MTRLLLVGLGGGLGSIARYLVVLASERVLGVTLPWGVLAVNVAGSFLIALVAALALSRADFSPALRLTLTTGFLGGLTTYSTFNQDTLTMLGRKQYGTAALYVALTVLACLLAGALGGSLVKPAAE